MREERCVEASCELVGKVYRMGEVEKKIFEAKGDASNDEEWEKEMKKRGEN